MPDYSDYAGTWLSPRWFEVLPIWLMVAADLGLIAAGWWVVRWADGGNW